FEADDMRAVLDEELARLPRQYREPLVLCYLQGLTKEEAARRLGCPTGTVSSRLTRGRERLRGRLARRGIAVTTAGVALGLEQASLHGMAPVALVHTTLQATLGATAVGGSALAAGVSTKAMAMAQAAIRGMLWTKVKVLLCCALGVGAAASATGIT